MSFLPLSLPGARTVMSFAHFDVVAHLPQVIKKLPLRH